MTRSVPNSPTTEIHPSLQPLNLEGEILDQRAWRMPDLLIYEHGPEEWWVSPLDEDLPLIRLNRMGAALLAAMDGRPTLASLLNQFGKWVCGPNNETGRWHLERWALPRYSLCYYGSEAPSGHSTDTKWDLMLQRVRERWHGNAPEETEDHLSEFHLHGIQEQHGHFEIVETTVSHLFREPCEALGGLTYGRLLGKTLRQMGWLTPKPNRIVEVGAGLGYLSQELGGEFSSQQIGEIGYTFIDITRPFLGSQITLARNAGWNASAVQANAERLPLANGSADLVIDNENLADMTPVQLTAAELETGQGSNPQHQAALDLIRQLRLPLDKPFPSEVIFNYGPITFLMELWRVLKPGGRAILIEFGIETGWPAPVKLPGHTEYEVQFTHLRHTARWLGFREQYCALPQLLAIRGDTEVLCTGAAYSIRRFCEALGKPFSVRAYTKAELQKTLGDTLPQLTGLHYHSVLDPAWFGLWDFKVLLVEKPGGTMHRPAFQESKGFRWYTQR